LTNDEKGVYLPDYYGFAVKSCAGEQDVSRSQIVTKSFIPGGKARDFYKGVYFDESKWGGSDIFRIQHATIIVTRQVWLAFKKAKLTNVRFTPLPEVESMVSNFTASLEHLKPTK